jgi:hypothetical protein
MDRWYPVCLFILFVMFVLLLALTMTFYQDGVFRDAWAWMQR